MNANLISELSDATIYVRPFGVTIARVWMKQRSTTSDDEEAKSNPYRFGDLPVSWAETFRRCIQGALVAADLKALPAKDSLVSNRFAVRGAQYGSLHISKNVSLFVDGWYSEIEPAPAEQCYACICVPTNLVFEVRDFFEEQNVFEELMVTRRGGVPKRIAPFKSIEFPDISFTIRFLAGYPEVLLSPTLREFEVTTAGTLSTLKFDGKTVAFGEISLPEARTLEVFSSALFSVPIDQLAAGSTYLDHVLENGVDDLQEFTTVCNDLIYVANDIISFVFPPKFLINVKALENVNPPAAVPTIGLARFMRDR